MKITGGCACGQTTYSISDGSGIDVTVTTFAHPEAYPPNRSPPSS